MSKTGDFKLKPNRLVIALLSLIGSASFGQQPGSAPYLDPNLPPERRAATRNSLGGADPTGPAGARTSPHLRQRQGPDYLAQCVAPRQRPGSRHAPESGPVHLYAAPAAGYTPLWKLWGAITVVDPDNEMADRFLERRSKPPFRTVKTHAENGEAA